MRRRIVLVSGAPAAGKTSLAAPLAKLLGLPLFAKDDLKETLVDVLGDHGGDLAWSRKVGGAAMELLWKLARLDARIVEVYCCCPADVLMRRFHERAKTAAARCAGHQQRRCRDAAIGRRGLIWCRGGRAHIDLRATGTQLIEFLERRRLSGHPVRWRTAAHLMHASGRA